MNRHQEQATQIIVLGGSGDLAKRKLLPALFHLYVRRHLPEEFQITAFAYTARTIADYRTLVRTAIEKQSHSHDSEDIDSFLDRVTYVSGSFEESTGYEKMSEHIATYESNIQQPAHRLFYLAVPPKYYESILENLHASNLAKNNRTDRWSRILIEKPFGNDYKSAQALDLKLGSYFNENQIFRIDHYLAKEAVQNILSFRFANPLLAPAWNKEFIKEVRISMKETVDVGERGGFYKDVGALRDVGQNHLLQVLALIAMDRPKTFDAMSVRNERAKALKALRRYNPKRCDGEVIRAQYHDFVEVEGVECDSDTETYFELKTYVDNRRWKNVPFYITAGKALDEAQVKVEIIFHELMEGLFDTETCATHPNKIELIISPNQSMHVTLNAKEPGLTYQVAPRTLSFDCEFGDAEIKNSYEKVLIDCIRGDQTLFASTPEVLASWKYVTSILEAWSTVPLQTYTRGSTGPEQSLLNE